MEKINKYIDCLYKDVDNSSKETEDLKQEMKSHLIETVGELKKNGIKEEKAVDVAIDKFGGEAQIRGELNKVLNFQKIFAKNTLKVAVIFLVLATILFVTSIFSFKGFRERYKYMNFQIDQVEHNLKEGGISKVDTYLKDIFEYDKNELNFIIVKELPKDFDEKKSKELFPGKIKYSYPKEIKSEYHHNKFAHEVLVNNNRYLLEIGTKTSGNTDQSGFYKGLSILAFALSWMLFIIWSIINIYRHGDLNTKWCIIMILMGIVGYFLYIICRNRKYKMKKAYNY